MMSIFLKDDTVNGLAAALEKIFDQLLLRQAAQPDLLQGLKRNETFRALKTALINDPTIVSCCDALASDSRVQNPEMTRRGISIQPNPYELKEHFLADLIDCAMRSLEGEAVMLVAEVEIKVFEFEANQGFQYLMTQLFLRDEKIRKDSPMKRPLRFFKILGGAIYQYQIPLVRLIRAMAKNSAVLGRDKGAVSLGDMDLQLSTNVETCINVGNRWLNRSLGILDPIYLGDEIPGSFNSTIKAIKKRQKQRDVFFGEEVDLLLLSAWSDWAEILRAYRVSLEHHDFLLVDPIAIPTHNGRLLLPDPGRVVEKADSSGKPFQFGGSAHRFEKRIDAIDYFKATFQKLLDLSIKLSEFPVKNPVKRRSRVG